MPQYSGSLSRHLERFVPWLILAFLSLFIYAKFFWAPYPGFRFAVPDGEVVQLFVTNGGLRLGDHLLQVGAVSWTDFVDNPRQTLFNDAQPGDTIPLQIRRDRQLETIAWPYPGPNFEEAVQRLNSLWWLSYVFWLAGTATFFLIHPRGITWRLMVAFNYLTATWLAAGNVSIWHIGLSIYVQTAAIWFCVPVYLHLHWLFPRPLTRIPAVVTRGAYLLTAVLVVADWLQLLPRLLNQYAYLVALLVSALLLLFRLVWRSEERSEVSVLAAAMLLAVLPAMLVGAASATSIAISPRLAGGALLALPAIPGAYFYTIYRWKLDPKLQPQANRLARFYLLLVLAATAVILGLMLVSMEANIFEETLAVGIALTVLVGTIVVVSFAPFLILPALAGAYVSPTKGTSTPLEFRANRLITPILFFILLASMAMTIVLSLFAWLDYPGTLIGVSLVATILTSVIALVSYSSVQRFVERKLLGVPLLLPELIGVYAGRITTSLNRTSLAQLLTDEVLPSLYVRQAAILLTAGSGDKGTLVKIGVDGDELPKVADLARLLEGSHKEIYASPGDIAQQLGGWVQLVLPLAYGNKLIGVWLLGRRDPDDLYSRSELPLLQTLSNQTAVALTNITITEDLQALYREDVERHESERTSLARTLHDDVLNELAVLAMYMDSPVETTHFQEAYDKLLAQLRLLISDLRPTMLQYGLYATLDELADDLTGRAAVSTKIQLNLAPTTTRYPEKVERHVFRIVQQAVGNALEHASAQTIHIGGVLKANLIELAVADDGVGFPPAEALDLPSLLTAKHYGLVGMHERAELIDATLHIDTAPGHGTTVSIIWHDDSRNSLG